MAEADDRCWVTVEGQLDGDTGEELHELLLALMGRGCQRVVVDLRQATFIGSSGLSMLVAAIDDIAKLGGELVLQAPPAQVYAQGRVRRLGELLAIVDEAINEAEAITRLSRLFLRWESLTQDGDQSDADVHRPVCLGGWQLLFAHFRCRHAELSALRRVSSRLR